MLTSYTSSEEENILQISSKHQEKQRGLFEDTAD